jgi:antimicrobial peptide system SdpA family protein
MLRRLFGLFASEGRAEGGERREGRSLTALGLLSLSLMLGWAAVFAYSVHAALPVNAVRLPLEERLYPQAWMPQGWKFFTRNPREEDLGAFTRAEDGRWVSALRGSNASARNLFGLSRATRAQGIELGLITTAVGQIKDAWQPCRDRLEVCVEQSRLVGEVRNITPNPTLCGEVGLTLQEPVPWAWSRSKRKVTMPSKAVRVNVICKTL